MGQATAVNWTDKFWRPANAVSMRAPRPRLQQGDAVFFKAQRASSLDAAFPDAA
jgi:hypothetical protein